MTHSMHRTVEFLDRCKDTLIDVGVLLEQATRATATETFPHVNQKLRAALGLADVSRSLHTLLRAPVYASYNPADLLRAAGDGPVCAGPRTQILAENIGLLVGDQDQVAGCLRLLVRNLVQEDGAKLRVKLTRRDGSPRFVFTVEGGAGLPAVLDLHGHYFLDTHELAEHWLVATGGGHLAVTPVGYILYLEGGRVLPDGAAHPDASAQEGLNRLCRRLRLWRNAMAGCQMKGPVPADLITLYRQTVASALAEAGRALESARQGTPSSA